MQFLSQAKHTAPLAHLLGADARLGEVRDVHHRADNRGEGASWRWCPVALRVVEPAAGVAAVCAGVFGAALFYGDGGGHTRHSMLSAVEGWRWRRHFVLRIPVALVVLIALSDAARGGQRGRSSPGDVGSACWRRSVSAASCSEILRALNPAWASASARSLAGWRWVRWCWPSPAAKPCMLTWGTSAGGPSNWAGSCSSSRPCT